MTSPNKGMKLTKPSQLRSFAAYPRCWADDWSAMRIRGLTIPTAMEQAMADGSLRRSSGSWQLNRPADAFGNLLEAELGEFYETAAAIEQATTRLPDDFTADGD